MRDDWGWLRAEERDFDAVLARLMGEASRVVPGLSADPKQADPVVVMLLRSFAREFVELYHVMDDSVGIAYRSLVSRLLTFPCAPEPATTVLRFDTKDAGARIPADFQATAPQPVPIPGRRSAQALFSPLTEGRTSSFEVAAVVLVEPSGTATRLADPSYPGLPDRWSATPRATPALFLALDSVSPEPDDPVSLFLHGDEQGVRTCLWSGWHVPARVGSRPLGLHGEAPEPPFVPGIAFHAEAPFDPPLFTFRSDLRKLSSPYENQMVAVGGPSLLSQACAAPEELGGANPGLPPARGVRHWVRISLSNDVDLAALTGLKARTNSVLAANRELRTSGAIPVDATPIHSWSLPDDVSFENLLRVEHVLDLKTGHEYRSASTREGIDAPRRYSLVEWQDRERRRVRVDLVSREEPGRRTEIQIDYSVTLGPAANGLQPGNINVAFTPAEVFPGLVAVTNLVETAGGLPARPAELQEEELLAVLRARGRAVIATDFMQMARAFDPSRILEVSLSRGVARGPAGLRSSIVVTAHTSTRAFVNELEKESFRGRLAAYLQDRCSIGETVQVQLVEARG